MELAFYAVSYDIEDDRRRLKVARALKGYGERVQKSVFEVFLNRNQREKLERELINLIDRETDSVRWYRLCNVCRSKILIQGVGQVTELPDAWVV